MKIRIISSRDEIENLNPDEEMVHLRFRPSNVDLICLTQRCSWIESCSNVVYSLQGFIHCHPGFHEPERH